MYEELYKKIMAADKTLLILMGLPGSGKSYIGRKLFEDMDGAHRLGMIAICSTDWYFMVRSLDAYIYEFDASKLGEYHQKNREAAEGDMKSKIKLIVIDNTNTTWKEIRPYCELALKYDYNALFVTSDTEWAWDVDECTKRNEHGVPREAIQRMKDRFESNEVIQQKYEKLKYGTWISAEAMLDTITWSKIPSSYDEVKTKAFEDYHNNKIGPMECCDILGIKHSYWFKPETTKENETV